MMWTCLFVAFMAALQIVNSAPYTGIWGIVFGLACIGTLAFTGRPR